MIFPVSPFPLRSPIFITLNLRSALLQSNASNPTIDTNVGGGLWSTVEVQVGFVCANLPHTRPLFLRWYSQLRSRTSIIARSSGNNYQESFNTRGEDRRGWRSLDSPSRKRGGADGVEAVLEAGFNGMERFGKENHGDGFGPAGIGLRDLARERIKIETEMRQEVCIAGKQERGGDFVGTSISAKT